MVWDRLRAGGELRFAVKATSPRPVRAAIRTRHYSYRTEETYISWIRRFIHFHGKRHPTEMGKTEITAFLTSLAVDQHVADAHEHLAGFHRVPHEAAADRAVLDELAALAGGEGAIDGDLADLAGLFEGAADADRGSAWARCG